MNDITLMDQTSIPVQDVPLPDGSIAKEFLLPSGSAVVRVRSVPPMMGPEILDQDPDLAEPPLPMVKVEGGQGIPDKMLPARPGEPEYEAYLQERKRREKLYEARQSDLTWDYGIVAWRRPPESEEWGEDPPKGWKFPAFLTEYGRKPRPGKRGRRVDFVKYVLIVAARDMEAVQMVMYGMSKPLTREEVDAAAGLFPGD
jgi:hypothetical protein